MSTKLSRIYFSEDMDKLIEEFATNPLQVLNQRLSLPAAEIFTKLKNWAMSASIKQNNTGFLKKTTVKDTTKVLAKISSDIFTNMFIAAQQQNTNDVPEEVKLPTTGAVKFATKSSLVGCLASFTEKDQSNNDAIFMDRG